MEEKTKGLNLNEFMKEVGENADRHGWWDKERNFGELIALCHSELSEALEEYRNGKEPDEEYSACKMDEIKARGGGGCGVCKYCIVNKPEGIPSELADVVIRILDMCYHFDIDIEDVLRRKHEFNLTRPYRHGKTI